MMSGVPLSEFPATLRDAVTITRRIGIRHLWVDALCIKQDSQDDWRRECSRMRDVYKGATLTLIAANASSVDKGIFSKRTFELAPSPLPWYGSNDGKENSSDHEERVYMRPSTWNQDTEAWPIQQRGWTLQEDLLSPRTLSYSKGRMIWQCSTHRIDEGARLTWPDVSSSKTILQDMLRKSESRLSPWISWTVQRKLPRVSEHTNPYSRWMVVVRDYTSRHLTKETDLLPAIAGLASEFGRQTRDTYYAGLWRKELLAELMWNLDPEPASEIQPPTAGPAEYRAPSWSWASINGVVRMKHPSRQYDRENVYERAKIIDVRVELLSSSEPYGQLKMGHLVLQGRFYHIGTFLDPSTASGPLPAAQKALQASVLVAPGMVHEFRQQHKPCSRQHFALLQMVAYAGWSYDRCADYLVLESATSDASVYRRIGFITLPKKIGAISSSMMSPHDRLAFMPSDYQDLAIDAFQELQEADAIEKTVKVI